MLRKLITAAVLALGLTAPASALPIGAPSAQFVPETDVIPVYGGCGPYGHRGPYGGCRPGGQAGGYGRGRACPPGFHLGGGGRRCWPNRY